MSKIAIIQFPGSNCENESLRAIQEAGMEAEEFLWNRNFNDLSKYDGYFIVGGFSYEDRSRSGIIAALDPLIPYLKAESRKGKPIVGVCNGAQILVETGLVPGLKNDAVGMALAVNKRITDGRVVGTGFYNAWVNMKLAVPAAASAFTRHLQPGQIIKVPVAHGEGRFIIPDILLQEMIANDQTTFRYCDEAGNTSAESPTNPNGAVYNIAAVTNPGGTIMAMMPHPERTPNGQAIFTSMRDYINEQQLLKLIDSDEELVVEKNTTKQLLFTPPFETLTAYALPEHGFELPVELIITDNEAATVENTLKHLGYHATVKRAVHWEITTTDEHDDRKQAVIASGELFNPSKEKIIVPDKKSMLSLLVRYRDDFVGQHKKEVLVSRFDLTPITAIKQGILWQITCDNATPEELKTALVHTHILHNPYSQECFLYE